MTDNTGSPDRVAPNSSEAEEAVLGSILINPESIFEVAAFLQATDFFIVRNAWVYEAIVAVQERGEAIDNLTVVQELQNRGQLESIGGSAYITRLINNTPTHIHAETYGRIVERAAIRRKLLSAAGEIAQVALEENAEIGDVIEHAEQALFAVTERRQRRELVPVQIVASEYFDRIEYLYNHQDEPLGLPTGFTDLDHLLGGLQRSDLSIVAARPGVGKTSFMLSLALNAARQARGRIAIFSMEMSTEQLFQRLISAETNINSQKLRLGNLDDFEWGKFGEATGRLSNLSLFMDDTPAISVPQMRTKSRRLYREQGLDLIIVDYLQLMSGNLSRNENRVQEISAISRGLKELARELNVPVLAAAQLSRAVEQRADKRPQLSDLRELGCLAGETLVYLPDSGRSVPIRDLAGKSDFSVLSLNPDTYKLEQTTVTNAFCTGVKPVYRLTTQLGRTVRATANHKFWTIEGWKRLDELKVGECVAAPLSPNPFPPRKRRERGDQIPVGGFHLFDGLTNKLNEIASSFTIPILLRPILLSQSYVTGSQELLMYSPPFPSACVGERAGDRGAVTWDQIAAISPDGESDVYDLTVPLHSNFVANNIVLHNSIEQDADIVMFIYRDDMYDENSERQNQADIIIAKHRNGPTGVITLFFRKEITQFTNMQKSNINLEGFLVVSKRAFKGFPAGKNASIQVPNAFFSQLLPLIDDLAELKLTVYCFWALQQREGKFRYVRLHDLLEDKIFLSGFDDDAERAEKLVSAALESAVERGTLLHVVVTRAKGDEHLYFMNTEKGRTAVEALERGDWVPGTHTRPVALVEERPNIFALYEQNIGPLTPLLSDILRDAENTYPAAWIEEAMKIAVENNKRNWRYVDAILLRWTVEGKKPPQPGDVYDQSPYLQDEYFRRRDNE